MKMYFKKRPEIYEAIQFTGNLENINKIRSMSKELVTDNYTSKTITVKTKNGYNYAKIGDWIIKDANEDLEIVESYVFEKMYEII